LIEQGVNPDWIVFPSSSGGTQAGLELGARLFGFTGQVLGMSIDEPARILKQRVALLATEAAALLGEKFTFSDEEILINDDYLGEGYGVMGAPEIEAINLYARSEGLLLDPLYERRAAAGLTDLIKRNFFDSHHSVVFWHTGGTPALFADRYQSVVD